MEVRPGYKQTEVGMIPEDWEVKPLGNFCETAAGRDLVKENFFPTSDDRYRYPIYSNALTNKGLYGYSKHYQYEADRITVTARGDVGHATYRSTPFCAIGRLLVLSSKCPCDLRFVTEYINNYVEFALESTGVPQLTAPQISTYAVAFPPTKAEQAAIAEALSDADALIESMEQLIAKKRQIKQGAMQELLTGKKRLPGFSGEWGSEQLSAIVQSPVTDGPHLTPQFLDDGVPFLSVNNLVDNKIDLSELRFISIADHEIFSRKCKPRKDDILLGKAASVGKVAIVDLDVEFNIWSPIALVRVRSDNLPHFVYYQFQSSDLVQQITLLTNSSSQGNIGMGDIERLMLKIPSIEEQIAIASILSDMDTELAALEAKLSKARQIKQGMMQELLTGRVRLVPMAKAA